MWTEEEFLKRIFKLDCEYLDDYEVHRRVDGAIMGTKITCSKYPDKFLDDCFMCDEFKRDRDDKMKDRKVRVFISQLMKDKSDEEIQAERKAVQVS